MKANLLELGEHKVTSLGGDKMDGGALHSIRVLFLKVGVEAHSVCSICILHSSKYLAITQHCHLC